jgi:hypothetical protein
VGVVGNRRRGQNSGGGLAGTGCGVGRCREWAPGARCGGRWPGGPQGRVKMVVGGGLGLVTFSNFQTCHGGRILQKNNFPFGNKFNFTT